MVDHLVTNDGQLIFDHACELGLKVARRCADTPVTLQETAFMTQKGHAA